MSSRIPPIAPADLTRDQRTVYDPVHATCTAKFNNTFKWAHDNGALTGPMSALLHTPAIARSYMELVKLAANMPGLPVKAREVAILITGVLLRSKFEVYAHSRLALVASLSDAQIEAIKQGIKPSGSDALDAPCEISFDVASELLRNPGPLGEDTWNRCKEVLGWDGTLALIQFVALYTYTSIVLNAIDEPEPES